MSIRAFVLPALAGAILLLQAAEPKPVNSGIIDFCNSTLTANAGVVLVCPLGDGDLLTAPVGGGNCQITLTVRDAANVGIPNIPAVDMWLVG
ncbi:MAG TPA: hypothetical protein VFH88_15310, partial [Candidatus Krumholzibacteria bacterium]|nr:hypothetical protein [Candidatus Krumholzibacteria bacterium]